MYPDHLTHVIRCGPSADAGYIWSTAKSAPTCQLTEALALGGEGEFACRSASRDASSSDAGPWNRPTRAVVLCHKHEVPRPLDRSTVSSRVSYSVKFRGGPRAGPVDGRQPSLSVTSSFGFQMRSSTSAPFPSEGTRRQRALRVGDVAAACWHPRRRYRGRACFGFAETAAYAGGTVIRSLIADPGSRLL